MSAGANSIFYKNQKYTILAVKRRLPEGDIDFGSLFIQESHSDAKNNAHQAECAPAIMGSEKSGN